MGYMKLLKGTARPIYLAGEEVPGMKYKARAEQTAVPMYLVDENGDYSAGSIPAEGTVTRAALAPEVAAAVDQVPEIRGRHELVLYDEFARYPDGPLNGISPLIGPAWVTSGASPIQIVNGQAIANQPTGTGYMWANFDDRVDFIECTLVVHGQPVSGAMTMAWSSPSGLNELLHSNINASGFNCTFRQDGESSWGPGVTDLLSGQWDLPLRNDGSEYRVGILVRGESWTIIGPHGEIFSGADPRVREITSENHSVFWEPLGTLDGDGIALTSVRAIRIAAGAVPDMLLPLDVGGAGWAHGSNGKLIASRDTFWQVELGITPDGQAGITFGPTVVRTRLSADVTVGATSITTIDPIMGGITISLGSGGNAETVVTIGNPSPLPGAGKPYTIGLTTTVAKAHSAGDVVFSKSGVPARRQISFNPFSPDDPVTFTSPTAFYDKVYTSSRFTEFFHSPAARTIAAGGVTGNPTVFRTGSGTTAQRPPAATVGAGAMYFDATLNKPIWSDGAAWRDAAGTVA